MTTRRIGFRFLRSDGSTSQSDIEGLGADTPILQDLVSSLCSLADSAGVFFRGVYPLEAPFLYWGDGVNLPWVDKYFRPTSDAGYMEPLPIDLEVARVLRTLEEHLTVDPADRQFACTYESERLSATPKLKIQGLAVEVMWSVDQCLCAIDAENLPVAMCHLNLAYMNLFECTCQAQILLGIASTNARKAAQARHRENHAMRAEVWRWCESHLANYKSMDAAAEAIAGELVPVTFRTARKWIGEWRRQQSARKA